VGAEDFERGHEVSQRNALVRLPLVVCVGIVDKDQIVVVLALVVDLKLGSLASYHFGGLCEMSCLGGWPSR